MEDWNIIELYFARSERAIQETGKKYGTYLGTIARNILRCPEDSEEVVNDVYLAAWNTLPPNRPNILKHYLSRITRNLSFKRYEYLTAEKRNINAEQMLSELDECIPDSRRTPEELLEAKELGSTINCFLAGLSTEDCRLFVARYYHAVPIEQLAKQEACSVRQIRYRLEKLRCSLRIKLEKEEMYK